MDLVGFGEMLTSGVEKGTTSLQSQKTALVPLREKCKKKHFQSKLLQIAKQQIAVKPLSEQSLIENDDDDYNRR